MSCYQVRARKWRPQTLQKLVGQPHIVNLFKHAIENNKIGHAYLFTGPRGVGKTSMARILAKSLICLKHKQPNIEPCGVCECCKGVSSGAFPDVMEIDAASNRGIDEVRKLRETLKYQPVQARYRIFIIDEAHMLTDAAFNALLKSLEEPPPQSVFVLATTEAHKIKNTIRSRCQTMQFRPLSIQAIVAQLQEIIQIENIQVETHIIQKIAHLGEGSLRDAQGFLDQLDIYGQGSITSQTLSDLALWIPEEQYIEFLTKLHNENITDLLILMRSWNSKGLNFTLFVKGLAEYLKNLLILKASGENSDILDTHIISIKDALLLTKMFSKLELCNLISRLFDLSIEFTHTTAPLEIMETFILRSVSARKLPSVASLLKRLETLSATITSNTTTSNHNIEPPKKNSPSKPAKQLPETWKQQYQTSFVEDDQIPRLISSAILQVQFKIYMDKTPKLIILTKQKKHQIILTKQQNVLCKKWISLFQFPISLEIENMENTIKNPKQSLSSPSEILCQRFNGTIMTNQK